MARAGSHLQNTRCRITLFGDRFLKRAKKKNREENTRWHPLVLSPGSPKESQCCFSSCPIMRPHGTFFPNAVPGLMISCVHRLPADGLQQYTTGSMSFWGKKPIFGQRYDSPLSTERLTYQSGKWLEERTLIAEINGKTSKNIGFHIEVPWWEKSRCWRGQVMGQGWSVGGYSTGLPRENGTNPHDR